MKQQLNIAANIYKLRKKKGMTQAELAEKLYVCNKTVSKWERGAGYPEITQLTSLAKILDTTVDNLLLGEKYGIAVVGNAHTDSFKLINDYPRGGMLANINSISQAVGGCVPHTAIDLAVIDRNLPVSAIGKIGNDEAGRFVLEELRKYGIDTSGFIISSECSTGFSDVMSVKSTGERTFFHHSGANSKFSPEDISVQALNCKMLHIGYILLLDKFDEEDAEYGTAMARFLKSVQDMGIKTSIDITSNNTEKFVKKTLPALKYTDNAIFNENEVTELSMIAVRDIFGKLLGINVKKALEQIMSYGVSDRVIMHSDEADFLLNSAGEFITLPSLKKKKIANKNAMGAGDAFCSGCLYAIYKGYDDKKILEFASGAVCCSPDYEDTANGMKSKEYIFELLKNTERYTL